VPCCRLLQNWRELGTETGCLHHTHKPTHCQQLCPQKRQQVSQSTVGSLLSGTLVSLKTGAVATGTHALCKRNDMQSKAGKAELS